MAVAAAAPRWRWPPSDACGLLQQLCATSEIAASEEMQEFLALNTDARIAFVKKPFIVSRIDKVGGGRGQGGGGVVR